MKQMLYKVKTNSRRRVPLTEMWDEIHIEGAVKQTQKCHLNAGSAGSENYKRDYQIYEMKPNKSDALQSASQKSRSRQIFIKQMWHMLTCK